VGKYDPKELTFDAKMAARVGYLFQSDIECGGYEFL
jgi:hypothetical protein